MDDTIKYRELFFEETDEYLQTLNDCILELEKNPEEDEVLEEIFRAAHTLKGMAATMGYNTMAKLTHKMESVFELFRQKTIEVNSDIISLIFLCLDKLSEIVEDLRAEQDGEYDIEDLLNKLDTILNIEDSQEKEIHEDSKLELDWDISDTDRMVIESGQEKNYKSYNIAVEIDNNSVLKGARAYLIINKLEQQGDLIKLNPPAEIIEEGEFGNIFKMIYLTKWDLEDIKALILNNAEIEKVLIEEIDDDYIQGKTEDKKEKLKDNKKDTKSKSNLHHMNQSIRVDLHRLDSFMNLVSELVIYRTRLEDITNKEEVNEIKEPLEHVARITTELQDLVLKIRMQPVNVVLNRFPRMIRDLSKELEKEIELVIKGEDTELDRTVVSELGEPLVHLIRNAADHGIESPQERIAHGKDEKGEIQLTAHQEGNRVIIIVKDDGKGIDPKVIKQSAEEKGIDTSGMDDKDLVQLIFHQGFSTNKEVTNVSGRGVGMDVVKQKISSLGGSIEVQSKIDMGTTFVIKLPLTLSIIQVLIVNIGEDVFALPLGMIEKVSKYTEDEIIQAHNNEVYDYNGRTIPVIRVNEKLKIQSNSKNNHIIFIKLGDKYFGLLVDDLVGQQEIAIKKLGKILKNTEEYLGATILGNGEIVLILDVSNLCKREQGDDFE